MRRGNLLMESSGCKSRMGKASTQAGSECCHSPGDWWVRSVHSKEAGREDSAPKTRLVAMPTLLTKRKAAVLRHRSTCEGGEPQGFRKERPRYPLEGRGEQADVSAEGNIGETQNSNCYVHKTRQTN